MVNQSNIRFKLTRAQNFVKWRIMMTTQFLGGGWRLKARIEWGGMQVMTINTHTPPQSHFPPLLNSRPQPSTELSFWFVLMTDFLRASQFESLVRMLTYWDLIFSGIFLTKSVPISSKTLREKSLELLHNEKQNKCISDYNCL